MHAPPGSPLFSLPGPYHWFLRTKILTGVGLISYALYMYHEPVNGLMHGFIFNQEPRISTVAELLVAFAVTAIAVALATLSYIYLERPIRRWAQRIDFSRKSSTRAFSGAPAGAALGNTARSVG
jgi:peptidoglycan/LPS O-acetylase OafA/YrhL